MQRLRTEETAIVFDFDGTLIDSGLDKGIHIMSAVWSAFALNGLARYLHRENPALDVAKMLAAYIQYPGAPRFQQLSAMANSLISGNTSAVEEQDLDFFPEDVKIVYPALKADYNRIYSGLNNTAAELYWKPFPSVHRFLESAAMDYDLYIASGVTEDLIRGDLERHSFDETLFRGIYGGNSRGGADKAELLLSIRRLGYPDLLFVADSNRDLKYAQQAGTRFFRIKNDNDFARLETALNEGKLPDEQDSWTYTAAELAFFTDKAERIIGGMLIEGRFDGYREITAIIHDTEARQRDR